MRVRDFNCRVTGYIEGTQYAHLVPKDEEAWWNSNGMGNYTDAIRGNAKEINSPQNGMLLRADIHKRFDDRRFVIAPKEGKWLAHVIQGETPELTQLYHNITLRPLAGVCVEYVFARFAWGIFTLINKFVNQGTTRAYAIRVNNSTTVRSMSQKDWETHRDLIKPPRSLSPGKRSLKRNHGEITESEYSEDHLSEDELSDDLEDERLSDEDLSDDCEADELGTRGRPRKRSFDSRSFESLTHISTSLQQTSQEMPMTPSLTDTEGAPALTSLHMDAKLSNIDGPDDDAEMVSRKRRRLVIERDVG